VKHLKTLVLGLLVLGITASAAAQKQEAYARSSSGTDLFNNLDGSTTTVRGATPFSLGYPDKQNKIIPFKNFGLNGNSNNHLVFRNLSSGTFIEKQVNVDDVGGVGDVDGDNKLEIVYKDDGNKNLHVYNVGTGNTQGKGVNLDRAPSSVVDVDGDGDKDVPFGDTTMKYYDFGSGSVKDTGVGIGTNNVYGSADADGDGRIESLFFDGSVICKFEFQTNTKTCSTKSSDRGHKADFDENRNRIMYVDASNNLQFMDLDFSNDVDTGFNPQFGGISGLVTDVNSPPQFSSTSVSPDPPLIGQTADFSYTASDPDGSISSVDLVLKDDGTTVFTGSKSSASATFSPPDQLTQGDITAEFTATDNKGATDTTTLTRTLTDTAPSVSVGAPNGDVFDYDAGIQVTASDDGDSRPNEDLSCTTSLDSSQIDTRTVTEGTTFTVNERADLGNHTASATCTETDDQQQDTGSTSFTTKAFEFNSISGAANSVETTNETFEANVRHGDMVESVDYTLNWNQSTETFSETYSSGGSSLETTQFTIPLARTDQETVQYDFQAQVNLSDINTGTETQSKTSSSKSQTVNFAYENPQVQLSTTDVIEDTGFTADLDFTNNLAVAPADLSAETSFNGATKTGFSPEFTAPLVNDANKSFTVTGNLKPSFQGRSDTRPATTQDVRVFRKILTDCTNAVKGVNGPQAQKIVLKNETEQSVRVTGDIEYNYDVSAPGSSHTRNYAFTETNTQTATTCLYPDFAEYQISGPVSYEASGFGKRVFPVQNTTITNSSTTLPLFLLPDTESTDTVIRVETPSGSPIDGTVKVLRFDVGTNTFTTAAKLETGSDGEAEVGLEDGAFYEFVVQNQDGDVIFTRDQEQFTPQTVPATVTLTVGQELPDFVENQDGFTFKVEEIKNNGNITGLEATVNHDTAALQNATLKVDKNAVIGENTICRKTVQTSASTLFCDFNETAEGNQFSFVLSSFVQGDKFVLQTGSIDKTKGLFGINQVFAGFLVFMSLSAFGFVTPRLTVMFSTAGVIAAYTLGLISVGVGAMASLVAVALIVTFAGERTV